MALPAVSMRYSGDLDVAFDNDFYAAALRWNERNIGTYLNWVADAKWVFEARFEYEKAKRNREFTGLERIVEMETRRLIGSVRHISMHGFEYVLSPKWINQEGIFQSDTFGDDYAGDDSFWLFDVSANYYFSKLKGKGRVSLSVKNLFNTDFQYQDANPLLPRFYPERSVSVFVSFDF